MSKLLSTSILAKTNVEIWQKIMYGVEISTSVTKKVDVESDIQQYDLISKILTTKASLDLMNMEKGTCLQHMIKQKDCLISFRFGAVKIVEQPS